MLRTPTTSYRCYPRDPRNGLTALGGTGGRERGSPVDGDFPWAVPRSTGSTNPIDGYRRRQSGGR